MEDVPLPVLKKKGKKYNHQVPHVLQSLLLCSPSTKQNEHSDTSKSDKEEEKKASKESKGFGEEATETDIGLSPKPQILTNPDDTRPGEETPRHDSIYTPDLWKSKVESFTNSLSDAFSVWSADFVDKVTVQAHDVTKFTSLMLAAAEEELKPKEYDSGFSSEDDSFSESISVDAAIISETPMHTLGGLDEVEAQQIGSSEQNAPNTSFYQPPERVSSSPFSTPPSPKKKRILHPFEDSDEEDIFFSPLDKNVERKRSDIEQTESLTTTNDPESAPHLVPSQNEKTSTNNQAETPQGFVPEPFEEEDEEINSELPKGFWGVCVIFRKD